MYNKTKLINQIMIDWSYKISNGTPDINIYEHRRILKVVLKEHNIPNEAINLIIQNLIYDKQTVQLDEFSSITTAAFDTRNKTHMTGSSHVKYIDPYQVQNSLPVQDSEEDEEELEDDNQKTFEAYAFDSKELKIIKTDETVSIDDILTENRFKCFSNGEVYYETNEGLLIKEDDIKMDVGKDTNKNI